LQICAASSSLECAAFTQIGIVVLMGRLIGVDLTPPRSVLSCEQHRCAPFVFPETCFASRLPDISDTLSEANASISEELVFRIQATVPYSRVSSPVLIRIMLEKVQHSAAQNQEWLKCFQDRGLSARSRTSDLSSVTCSSPRAKMKDPAAFTPAAISQALRPALNNSCNPHPLRLSRTRPSASIRSLVGFADRRL
jgi:hypothetical protein